MHERNWQTRWTQKPKLACGKLSINKKTKPVSSRNTPVLKGASPIGGRSNVLRCPGLFVVVVTVLRAVLHKPKASIGRAQGNRWLAVLTPQRGQSAGPCARSEEDGQILCPCRDQDLAETR